MRRDQEDGSQLLAVSVVFPDGAAAPGHLNRLDPAMFGRQLTRALSEPNIVDWLAAGFDISLNDDTAKGLGTYWQLQVYGTASVRDPEAFATALRNQFPTSKRVNRTVQVKASDGSRAAISYGLKPGFVRRVAYLGEAGPPGQRRRCWKTRKVSLRAREHVELLLWLHKIGLAGRLYFRGVRMTRTRDGVALVKIRMRGSG